MYQRIRGLSRRLVVVACGVFMSSVLALSSAAPVLAKTFHGGAHGRMNTLVESGRIVPIATTDLIALGVAAAVVGIAVAVDRRLSARKATTVRLRSVPSGQAADRRRAA